MKRLFSHSYVILPFLLAALLFTACKNKSYTITAQFPEEYADEINGQTFHLFSHLDMENPMDSAVVTDCKLVFKGNGRPAIPRVRFEYNPGVHLFAADSLESKGTLQNLPAGIEATVGPESGFHLVLVHYRNLIVV